MQNTYRHKFSDKNFQKQKFTPLVVAAPAKYAYIVKQSGERSQSARHVSVSGRAQSRLSLRMRLAISDTGTLQPSHCTHARIHLHRQSHEAEKRCHGKQQDAD